MANRIQVKRGKFANLPTLNQGELGLCTDTKQLFIGNTQNLEVLTKESSFTKNLATVYNVKNYGAKPNDPSVDNTSAIQNAIDDAHSKGGGIVFFPAGVYYIKNEIDLKQYVWLEGSGSLHIDTNDRGSVIEYNGSSKITMIHAYKDSSEQYYRYGVGLKNIQIRGNDVATGLGLRLCSNTHLENVIIEFCDKGLIIEGGMLDVYERIYIRYCVSRGLYIPNTYQTTTQTFNACYIGQHKNSPTCVPLEIENHAATDVTFNELTFESNNLRGKIGIASTVKFNDLYIENCPVKDTVVMEFGCTTGTAPEMDNYNGVYSISGGNFLGVPSSLGGYSGKSLFLLTKADTFTMSDCFMSRFENIITRGGGTKTQPVLIGCVCENGLFTNKFDSLGFAYVLNCLQDGTTYVNKTPMEVLTPPLENSWVNSDSGYEPFTVTKQGNIVNIRGSVQGGSTYTIATLPANCRPKGRIIVTCCQYDSDMWNVHPLHIYPNGTIQTNNSLKSHTMFDVTFMVE